MKSNVLLADEVKSERDLIYERFSSRIKPDRDLDRSLVSYQANKKTPFYNWFKYKEGFSAWLVQKFIELTGKKRGVLLDPFAGSGTSLFVARHQGWDSIGIELMPVGVFAIDARLASESITPAKFKKYLDALVHVKWDEHYDPKRSLEHIPITAGAFPPETERCLSGFRAYCEKNVDDFNMRKVLEFAAFCVLEEISYTRKDGQYLRWDARCGRKKLKSKFDKGKIRDFDESLKEKLFDIHRDLSMKNKREELFPSAHVNRMGSMDVRKGSCLDVMPSIPKWSVDLVVTSPPYCNRYDYTRTYALELVYLGLDLSDVNSLRQKLLSCTVENKAKNDEIREGYARRGDGRTLSKIADAYDGQSALHEILDLLEGYAKKDLLNNSNIPRMVKNYFFEMCVVIYEMSRVLKPGGMAIMVNDNVRYHGEEVPVDLILCDFAEKFGLTVDAIWTLPRGKGNSSQQMGAHGRSELRKCVYVWRKQS